MFFWYLVLVKIDHHNDGTQRSRSIEVNRCSPLPDRQQERVGHSGIAIILQPYSMCYRNLSLYELTELAGVLVARRHQFLGTLLCYASRIRIFVIEIELGVARLSS